MRAWVPIALTLVLAMVASAAQAQDFCVAAKHTTVAANNSEARNILIHHPGWRRSMSLNITDLLPTETVWGDLPPSYYLSISGVPCVGVTPHLDEFWADLDLQSNSAYVLYLTIGDTTRRILSFNPGCSRFGATLLGTFSSLGYLFDGVDWDESFWREQLMNEEVKVEVNLETPDPDLYCPIFSGVIPPVSE
jgi:hypothetical protein